VDAKKGNGLREKYGSDEQTHCGCKYKLSWTETIKVEKISHQSRKKNIPKNKRLNKKVRCGNQNTRERVK